MSIVYSHWFHWFRQVPPYTENMVMGGGYGEEVDNNATGFHAAIALSVHDRRNTGDPRTIVARKTLLPLRGRGVVESGGEQWRHGYLCR